MSQTPEAVYSGRRVLTLGGQWLIATDPANVGCDAGWQQAPTHEATVAKLPRIIQTTFPGYHGVAWYWYVFTPPANHHLDGRSLLRFHAVDYQATVWLNGVAVGAHEGGETPFVCDVTEALRPGADNCLAVRVINPTHEPIDGIVLNETPHRNKEIPYRAGASYDHGGLIGPVELVLAPAVYVADVFARPDLATGEVRVAVAVCNATGGPAAGELEVTIAPAAEGETVAATAAVHTLPPGRSELTIALRVDAPVPWDLGNPFLYRVSVRVRRATASGFDEYAVRCGFRDFTFANGYFRLNGRRLFLRGSHTGNSCPVGLQVPHDPDLLRRDLIGVKLMGFNMIRFIAGVAYPYQLDLCDELGLLVYEESYAGWCLADSPHMAERFDRSTAEMIVRDRNHPSVAIWGLLNETGDGPVLQHAMDSLPLVRSLDDSRLVLLASGRWDGRFDIGSLSNPGSHVWEHHLGSEAPDAAPASLGTPGGYVARAGDAHAYPRVPHLADTIRFFRNLGADSGPVFLSEYGIGSAVDLWRTVHHYERLGAAQSEDGAFYADKLARFLQDWERWHLAEVFGRPADYFRQCLAKMAAQRLLGLNAIRANPCLVGYSLTGTVDQGMTGEGLTTTFRELKPGTLDAIFDGLAPLRWCLFAEPCHVYRGATVRLEAVLANEDVLQPEDYPVEFMVLGPQGECVWQSATRVTVPARPIAATPEPPLAWPVMSHELAIDSGEGEYRFVATFLRGAAATGGEATFFVTDAARMPAVATEVALWGEDPTLLDWLGERGIIVRPFAAPRPPGREVILAAGTRPDGPAAFAELTARIEAGATAVFLEPGVFAEGDDRTHWLPLEPKGELRRMANWVYLKDEWAVRHPIFDGLPAGGLMDYGYYREIIPDDVWVGQDDPQEVVAGAINTSQDYASGLLVAVYGRGAGRLVLSSLRIRENLGTHPAAERLLRNMLRYAGGE